MAERSDELENIDSADTNNDFEIGMIIHPMKKPMNGTNAREN